MNWRIVTVGKPTFPWAKEALDLYLSRIRRYVKIEYLTVKEGPSETVDSQIHQLSADSLQVLLDERGKMFRSLQLASWVEAQELSGTKRVTLILGGANGHSPALKAQVRESWSLSTMTLQHDMALVVLTEQVYRAYSILRKEPYHRE